MSSRRNRNINLPAPYLRRIWLDPARIADRKAYPFCLPFLHDDFELSLDRAITIIVGENGTGKSTLLEGIAVLTGFDEAGGGKGYRPVDHSNALEVMGGEKCRCTVAILYAGFTHDTGNQKTRGVSEKVPFASLDLLACIVATRTSSLGRFNRLAVDRLHNVGHPDNISCG